MLLLIILEALEDRLRAKLSVNVSSDIREGKVLHADVRTVLEGILERLLWPTRQQDFDIIGEQCNLLQQRYQFKVVSLALVQTIDYEEELNGLLADEKLYREIECFGELEPRPRSTVVSERVEAGPPFRQNFWNEIGNLAQTVI